MFKNTVAFLVATAVLAGAAYASMREFDEVPVTRWIDGGNGVKLKTVEQIRDTWEADAPFFVVPVRRPRYDGDVYCIVVNDELYPTIEAKLVGSYAPALELEGYSVNIYRSAGGAPEDLRDFLITQYNESGDGFTVLLVGNLPIPLFEIENGHENGRPFPCDLFYMDLDGVWKDEGFYEGVFDVHEGEVEADVRLGRWTASPLIYNGIKEATLVNHYIDKVLAYRNDTLRCSDKALCYVDDDWEPWGPEWASNMGLAYPYVEAEYDPYTTYDTDYEDRLIENYEFIQVCAHSTTVSHTFKRAGSPLSFTYIDELYKIKPVALFYNLFACSNARFSDLDYMAGWYTFMDNDYGLAAVGSTKSGAMLHFDDFYRPLGSGQTLGEAFRYWFAIWADSEGVTSRDWHYGMTVIGDPTLHIRPDLVPIIVRGFSGRYAGEGVVLTWDYDRSLPVRGFNLYRTAPANTSDDAGRTKVNGALISGTPPMKYFDEDVPAAEGYTYELEAVTGTTRRVVASADVGAKGTRPKSFVLAKPAPNPASGSTTISFAVTSPGAKLEIYDVAGRKVKSFDVAQAGPGSVTWDLAGRAGNALPAGVYIINLRDDAHAAAARVVINRP